MKMRVKKIITVVALTVLATGGAQAGGIPVIDAANLANTAQNLVRWAEQLKAMEKELTQLKAEYDALNGTRGIANLLNNDLANQYLPTNYQNALNGLMNDSSGEFSGISGSLNTIINANQAYKCEEINELPSMQEECKKRWKQYALDKKVGELGYEKSAQNISNLQQYISTITSTTDPKSLMDLQARIGVEQVRMQNEQIKLQTIAMMKEADKQLKKEKSSDSFNKGFNQGANGGISFSYTPK